MSEHPGAHRLDVGGRVTHGFGFDVWLQGGPGDGVRATVFPEPPDVITYSPSSAQEVAYVRVPAVEQFDRERIYYPASAGAECT